MRSEKGLRLFGTSTTTATTATTMNYDEYDYGSMIVMMEYDYESMIVMESGADCTGNDWIME